MDELAIKALYASVVEDDEEGFLFIGFAEGEDETEPYVLFRQALTGGPIWFEVADESLGGDDVVEKITRTAKGITITIHEDFAPQLGFAREIPVKISAYTESADDAVEALQAMFGDRFIDA